MNFSILFTAYGWELLILLLIFCVSIPIISLVLSFVLFQVGLLLPINKDKIKGRHVLVIGASQGLGKALSFQLANLGASRVTLAARGTDKDESGLSRLEHAVEEIKANTDNGVEVEALKLDVTDSEKVFANLSDFVDKVGKIDWVIISSGLAQFELFNKHNIHLPNNEKKMMELNYFGPVNAIRSILLLGDKKGKSFYPERIITVGSVASCCPMAGSSAYSASKTALKAFSENLRNEIYFYPNIKLHHFLPAAIDTPGFEVENLTKPKVTREIEGSIDAITPDYAAKALLNGITREQYNICSDFIGFMARHLSNSINPRNLMVLDMLASPLYTLVGDILYRVFDHVSNSEAKLNIKEDHDN